MNDINKPNQSLEHIDGVDEANSHGNKGFSGADDISLPPHPQGVGASFGGGYPEKGASPCNTAPSTSITCSVPPIKVLLQGIDSLYLSYKGRTNYFVYQALLNLKDLAKSEDPEEQALAVYTVREHQFEVKPTGAGKFVLVLTNNAYRIQLSSLKALKMPLVQVQIRSAWLLKHGVEKVCDEITEIIKHFGEVEDEAQVSRADLYVDFLTDYSLRDITDVQWVSRALYIVGHSIGRERTGYSIGTGGDISSRLYDKTKEIQKSNKDYLKPLWHSKGWQPGWTVWRKEFQFLRATLTQHSIHTVPDLLDALSSIWRYGCLKWLRLTIPNPKDKTQSRWPLHPVWEALSNVPWDDQITDPSLPVRSSNPPSSHYMFVNGLGGYSSYLAVKDALHSDEMLKQYFTDAIQFHNMNSFHTGADFDRYINEKAAIKAKRANLPFPKVEARRDEKLLEERKHAADDYQRARDGEQDGD